MKLKQLEYLVKVMECGSITQAAQQMSVSQPSLTKAISSLEEEYGIQIIRRKSRGVEFTSEGLDFVLYARGVLAAANAYPKVVSKSKSHAKAKLFVASQQIDFLHPLVLDIYKQHCQGNVFFNVVETDRSNVVDHILRGAVDLGIVVRTSMDMKDMIWDKEAHRLDIDIVDISQIHVALGPKNPFWNRSTIKLEELSPFLHIAMDMEEEAKQSFWLENGQYSGFNNNRIVYVNTVAASEKFLLETEAISYCSYWTKECFKDSNIHIVPVEGNDCRQDLLLIRRKGEALSRAEYDFVSAIYSRLGKTMPEHFAHYEKDE